MVSERFVGRRAQLSLLDSAARLARAGEPQFVALGGEAGVGKTRLMERFTSGLDHSSARVWRTGCLKLGSVAVPLAPVTAALRQLVYQLGPETVTGELPGGDVLLRSLPEFGEPANGHNGDGHFFDLFVALLHRLGAERPLVWVIDDLHLADSSTRDLLGFVARRLHTCDVMVIMAYRTDDLDKAHPLRPFLVDMDRLRCVRRTELTRFCRARTAELVSGVLACHADAEFVDMVYRRSDGNAYLAEELTKGGITGPLPDSLRDTLLHRIRQLPSNSRLVLQQAAVCGQNSSHALLAAIGGLTEVDLISAIRVAVDARILIPQGVAYQFQHSLLRDAVVDDLLPVEQRQLHRAFAAALESNANLITPERYAAEIAIHWHQGGEATKALPAVLRAAAAAGRVGDHRERAQMLEKAASLWRQVPNAAGLTGTNEPEVYESAVLAAADAADYRLVRKLADQGLNVIDPIAEPVRAALLHTLRGIGLHYLGSDGVRAAVDEAMRLLPLLPSRGRARVLDELAALLVLVGSAGEARDVAEEAARIALEFDDPVLEISARTTQGRALAHVGDYHAALTTLRAACERAEHPQRQGQLNRIHLMIARTLRELGEHDGAIDTVTVAIASVQSKPSERADAGLYLELALSLFAAGRWDESVTTSARGLRLDPPLTQAAALRTLRSEIALAQGQLAMAQEELFLAVSVYGGAPADIGPWTLGLTLQTVELAVVENRISDARALIEKRIRQRNDGPLGTWELLTTAARVETRARALYPGSDLRTAVDALRAVAADSRADTPLLAAYAAEFAAEVAEPHGSWAAAVVAWDSIGQGYRAAHARLRMAAAVVGAGDRALAREQLQRAAAEAERLGARPLLEEVRSIARTARLELAVADMDSMQRVRLTEREVEVLRMIAAGLSNGEIAKKLFISTKTVSVHVSNILARFGVSRRGEAAAAARRLRLFDAELGYDE